MALGLLGLFLHAEDLVVVVELDYTGALELLDRGLFVAHNAGGAFLLREVDKFLKAEEKEVVGCDHQHIVIDAQLVHRKEQITHRPKPSLIRLRPIINNCNGFLYF